MTEHYNYDSPCSFRVMTRIEAVLLKRAWQGGATQGQIASLIGASVSTVSRFIKHMLSIQLAHEAGKNENNATLYKPGPAPDTIGKMRKRTDPYALPAAFFGSKK